ncbi:MAG TPA: tRNA epoxyqueuosine(34) reductase QueG [Anaerolineales bacterium]|nr:tRNA epoxyqueuosine(34) reductase QueG [Anaerolineales bacterium]
MDRLALTAVVKQDAARLGFELVGVTTPDPPPHIETYRNWIAHGRNASMHYLSTERAVARRSDPDSILAGCRSVLVVGLRHTSPPSLEAEGARFAAYAVGADYHEVIPSRLRSLVDSVRRRSGASFAYRIYTDTGPILERDLAQRAGLGWIGKNTCLIHPRHGSYFLLGEVFLTLALEPDRPFDRDRCGSCTRCIEACPTRCIRPDRTLEASQCISYLTIEHRGSIPEAARPAIGSWLFGCDVCQQVCPWNMRFAAAEGDPEFQTIATLRQPDPGLFLDPGSSPSLRRSALARAGKDGMARNAAVVLGNLAPRGAEITLAEGLRHPHPTVREHAAWALGVLATVEAEEVLRAAQPTESDPGVLEEINRALSRFSGRGLA